MSTPSSPPGWHPDPTGAHQLRYFNGDWTEHVSDNGVQSVSPMPSAPPPPPTTAAATAPPSSVATALPEPSPTPSTGKAKWVVAGIAAIAIVAVLAAVLNGSSDDNEAGGSDLGDSSNVGDSGVDSHQSFCDDVAGTWGIVTGGIIATDSLTYQAANNPTFEGADVDVLNSITQAAQDASVVAAEAPDLVKEEAQSVSDYLNLGLKLAAGDTSVLSQMTDNTAQIDGAYVSAQAKVNECAG